MGLNTAEWPNRRLRPDREGKTSKGRAGHVCLGTRPASVSDRPTEAALAANLFPDGNE
ncbi:hypothetical protein J6590_088206 [Homalodisca vitripennis]|nr:hypothetical protein J6590_088206 [Homalodisca vitripennis]